MDIEKRNEVRKSLRDGSWHSCAEVSERTEIAKTGLTGITRHDDLIERRKENGSVQYRFMGSSNDLNLGYSEMNPEERMEYLKSLGLPDGKIIKAKKSALNRAKEW